MYVRSYPLLEYQWNTSSFKYLTSKSYLWKRKTNYLCSCGCTNLKKIIEIYYIYRETLHGQVQDLRAEILKLYIFIIRTPGFLQIEWVHLDCSFGWMKEKITNNDYSYSGNENYGMVMWITSGVCCFPLNHLVIM